MAGFSGIDDYQTETTTNGKIARLNFNRTIDTGATSAAGRWHSLLTTGGLYMPRAAGDTGVQRIVSYAINTGATSGVGAFLLHRPIVEIPLAAANTPSLLTLLNDDPALARVYDDSCLGFMINIGGALTAGGIITGSMNLVWG